MSSGGGGGGGGAGGQFQFLDLSDGSLSTSEKNTLANIMQQPSSVPLPGTQGVVWKTPRNSSPEFEFGDGVSAVFKSLSVSSPADPDPTPVSRHVLSANTAPFVPSMQPPHPNTIPIPLPSMGNGQQAHSHIHINNFTANLNYPAAVPMPTNIDRESPVVTTQYMPHYTGHYMPGPGQYEGQPHGHYPSYPAPPFVIVPQHAQVPLHPAAAAYHLGQHQQHQPQVPISREEQHNNYSNGAGITFGSTPVVSIRAGTRNSETDDSYPDGNQSQFQSNFPQPPIVKNNDYQVKMNDYQTNNMKQQHQDHIKTHDYQQQQRVASTRPTEQSYHGMKSPDYHNNSVSNKDFPSNNQQQKYQEREPTSVKPGPRLSASDNSEHVMIDFGQGPNMNIQSSNITKPPVSPIEPLKPVVAKPDKTEELHQAEAQATVDVGTGDAGATDGAAAAGVGSWASLFASKSAAIAAETSKPTARIQPFSASEVTHSDPTKSVNTADLELGKFLKSYSLKHVSAALLPRGLLNRSNWCFVNAILQALLACPPFYNMMKNLTSIIHPLKQSKSKTPMLDSILEFVSEFSILETAQINKPQKKDKNRKKDDIVTGVSLEPIYVYNMLLNLEDETFKVMEGRQEDAEEFLSCLLNGLSDEMTSKIKLVADEASAESNEAEEEETDDEWKEVGAKGRSCVTRRVNDTCHVATPIQSLALGTCRSCVKSEAGDNSATLQPFYTLQLDIQDEDVRSVSDALIKNFANEKLDGFICSKTKKEIEATRSLSIEELPPILILHLKRFVYDGITGGVQKVMKQVEFSVDLEISKTILSAECRASNKQRQYKLFSVVYHNGREATKGHYVTDIFHTGYSSWLHCDDSLVTPTCEQSVLSPSPTSTPYILLYRRGDTMVGMEKKTTS